MNFPTRKFTPRSGERDWGESASGGDEVEQLFAGWRDDLAACRKFPPAARNCAAVRLSADVGLRINEAWMLDLDDARWDLGRFGKLNVRFATGADPLHLTTIFDLSETTAVKYAALARRLLHLSVDTRTSASWT